MLFDTHESAKNSSIKSFEYFKWDFITTCSLISLQCFASQENFGCSDVVSVLTSPPVRLTVWYESNWVQIFKILIPSAKKALLVTKSNTVWLLDRFRSIRPNVLKPSLSRLLFNKIKKLILP